MTVSHIKTPLTFVRSDCVDSMWNLYFKRPQSFTFEAGDWIELQFKDEQLQGGNVYSLSSSPTEDNLRITFRDGLSPFKQRLQNLASGDTVILEKYGNDYNFQLRSHQTSMLIAGGIGIAPFRSMIEEFVDLSSRQTVTLLYINKNDSFLFKEELDEWARLLSHFSVEYIVSANLSRKKRNALLLSRVTSVHQNFYISGPDAMVESTEHLLIDAGVAVRNIRIDNFGMY
jgi:ferredoxin-NADP reductase